MQKIEKQKVTIYIDGPSMGKIIGYALYEEQIKLDSFSKSVEFDHEGKLILAYSYDGEDHYELVFKLTVL